MSSQEFKVGDLVLAHDSENKQKIGVVAEAVDGSIFDSDSCPDQLLFVFLAHILSGWLLHLR